MAEYCFANLATQRKGSSHTLGYDLIARLFSLGEVEETYTPKWPVRKLHTVENIATTEVSYPYKELLSKKPIIVKVAANDQSLEEQFNLLATQWKDETFFISSFSEKTLNFAYQRIIGMGPTVLPYILKDLQEDGGDWFWALQCISGEVPYTEHDRGNIPEMTKKWIDWGKSRGYI